MTNRVNSLIGGVGQLGKAASGQTGSTIKMTCPDGSQIDINSNQRSDRNILAHHCSKFWHDNNCECLTSDTDPLLRMSAGALADNLFLVRNSNPHLSKGTSGLKQKSTQTPTPFLSTVFHALSHGEIHFLPSVSSKNL